MPSAATTSRMGRIMTKPMIAAAMVLLVACGSPAPTQTEQPPAARTHSAPPPAGTLDQLLAPIALYPDPLLAQMLMSATNPSKVTELDKWLKSNAKLKGTALQDAAVRAGFDASFVALVLFPQVVTYMAEQIAWTRVLGQAFESDKSAVFASIQKLRKQAQTVGTLKSTPQQAVETKTTKAGEQVIVIGPRYPQIVYAPQYNTEVVSTGPYHRDYPGGRRRRRRGNCGGSHWVYRRHRDWRSDQQPLLLRSIRMARRRLHAQQRVERLLRRTGRCARGLDGSPRRPCRGTRRSDGRPAGEQVGPRGEHAGATHRPPTEPPGKPARRAGPTRPADRTGPTRPADHTGPTRPADHTGAKRLHTERETEREREPYRSHGSARPDERDPGSAE